MYEIVIFAKFDHLYGLPHSFVLCLVGECSKIVIFAYFYGPTHCLIGVCGKIVIFTIFTKFATFANLYEPPHCFVLCLVTLLANGEKLSFSPYWSNLPHTPTCMRPSLLCALPGWRTRQNCHFHRICQIRHIRQLIWAPSSLCALLANLANLSFSPY